METHRRFLKTFICKNQLKNTEQDLKIYCSNHDVRNILQNLSCAIAGHTYGINLLPQVMIY